MVSGMMESSISNASEDRRETSGMHQDTIIDRFRVEFLDFAADALDELDKLVAAERDLHGDHEKIIEAVHCNYHNLKGMGGTFGYPLITLLVHRWRSTSPAWIV